MRDYETAAAATRRKSINVKAHHRLADGPIEVMVFGNNYKTWREQMDEYEQYGRRTDLTLVALHQSPERFMQHGLKWCDYDSYQAELDFEAKDLKRPRQLSRFLWTKMEAAS